MFNGLNFKKIDTDLVCKKLESFDKMQKILKHYNSLSFFGKMFNYFKTFKMLKEVINGK